MEQGTSFYYFTFKFTLLYFTKQKTLLSQIQMRTELFLRLQHFGFLPHAFLTAQKGQLLPFQLYSCMRPMGMVMCLCEDMLVGAQEHVCAHARGSQMPALLIFFDNSPLYFLRQVLWTWNSAWAGWPSSPVDLPASATSQGWLKDHSLLLAFYVVCEFQAKVLGFQSRDWAFPPVPPHQVFFGHGECFLSSSSFLRYHTATALQLCWASRTPSPPTCSISSSTLFGVALPLPLVWKAYWNFLFCYQRVRWTSLFPPRKRLHLDLGVYLKSHFHP